MTTEVAPTPPTLGVPEIPTFTLRLASGNGPIYRIVLQTPLRDADPAEIHLIDIAGASASCYPTARPWLRGYKPPGSQRLNPFESIDVRESSTLGTYDPRFDPAAEDPSAAP
ncbi:hypothetical protein DL765_008309 [Monosporascus sp. GIB2]|nr:hypothetical protein DL765_008309 [Monosporascus sp. GIB2]